MEKILTSTPKVDIVTASEELVERLLALNTRNRSHKKNHINQMAADIKTKEFFLTASGIGVSKTGVLLDGQNRLMAMRQAGYPPVNFVLCTGLEDESQRVVDRHARRSLGDALTIHMNVTISSHMVALTNAIFEFGATRNPRIAFSGSTGKLADGRVADFLAEYSDLAFEVIRAAGGARASITAAVFVYALHEKDMAIEFAESVHKGTGLSENDPAYRLRLAIARLSKSHGAAGRTELFKSTASACISHSAGRSVKLLRGVDSWETARWKWAIKSNDIFSY
jgi:hypothetical protein